MFLVLSFPLLTLLKSSGYYMYHQFNIQQRYVLPQCMYLCVLCGSENKKLLFHYTALQVFTTETECVYCEVRTECLYIIHVKSTL